MSRRYRNRKSYPIWKWLYFGFFILTTLWLLISIYVGQNPSDLLKKAIANVTGNETSHIKTTEELEAIIKDKDGEIALLQSKIDSLESSQFQIATVSVDSPTLNLRSSASLTSDIVFKIPNGSAVEILYYDTKKLFLKGKQGQWCKIKYADMEGWVWGNFLSPKG